MRGAPPRDLRCTVEETLPADLAPLLESVTFGTAGLRYRRLDVEAQLRRLHDPVCIAARRGEALVGAYLLDRRELLVAGERTSGVYRGSLCVAPTALGQGVGRALAACGRDWTVASSHERGAPILSWGCVDVDNHRSLALLASEGAVADGALAMFMCYRQWPRERLALEPLAPGRDAREAPLLAATERDCGARDVTPSRLPGLAASDAEGLRISARVAASGYRVETLGRGLDALVAIAVRPFPPARRRFDPRAFRYVRLADVGLREGCERDWPAFVSTLLARHGAHFALTFVDPEGALHRRLRGIGPLGALVHRPSSALRIMTRWADAAAGGRGRARALPPGARALAPVDG